MGVTQIWGFTDETPECPEGFLVRRPPPLFQPGGLGRERGLPYPWSHHLARVRGNPLCEGTWTHTQGHLGVEKEGRCYRWLWWRWGQQAYTHLRTSCQPAFRFCSQLPAYHSPRGSSPRGGVRLEPFSLRAEPEGRKAAAGLGKAVPQGPGFQGAAVSCEFRGRREGQR